MLSGFAPTRRHEETRCHVHYAGNRTTGRTARTSRAHKLREEDIFEQHPRDQVARPQAQVGQDQEEEAAVAVARDGPGDSEGLA